MPTAQQDADWQAKQNYRTTPGAPMADPSKNIGAITTGGTSKLAWDAQFKPNDALSAALAQRPLTPPPSAAFSTLRPLTPADAPQPQSLEQMAAGGQNHEMAWTAGQRAPQSNQAPFSNLPDYLKRDDPTATNNNTASDDMMKRFSWGSGLNING